MKKIKKLLKRGYCITTGYYTFGFNGVYYVMKTKTLLIVDRDTKFKPIFKRFIGHYESLITEADWKCIYRT